MLNYMARIAILTCSDAGARGERQDISGDILASRLQAAGHEVSARALCPDDRQAPDLHRAHDRDLGRMVAEGDHAARMSSATRNARSSDWRAFNRGSQSVS